jgi:hypothetical protein
MITATVSTARISNGMRAATIGRGMAMRDTGSSCR